MEKQLSTPAVLSDTAHNASVLYSYIFIHSSSLVTAALSHAGKSGTPLAVNTPYDTLNDAAAREPYQYDA